MGRQRDSWTIKPRIQKSLSVAAFLVVLEFVLGIVVGITFSNDATIQSLNALSQSRTIALVVIPIGAIIVLASAYFWIGMLCFFVQIDWRPSLSKILWLMALVLTNVWAALPYYFIVYRPFVKGHLSSAVPQPV